MQLNVRDVSQLLKVPELTVQRWIADAGLPARRIGSQFFINRNELLEWATLRKQLLPPEFFQQPQSAPAISLAAALRIGGIVYGIPGTDKTSALRAVVDHLPLPAGHHREELAGLFLAREAAGSTSIGGGIAIPHPRHPIVIPGAPLAITLCFPLQPIPFDAPDGRPVHALFATIAPNPRTHLHALARLASAVHDPGIEAALKQQRGPDDVLAEFERLDATFDPNFIPNTGAAH
jgi:PTS system nitrogen regulatory IIA component